MIMLEMKHYDYFTFGANDEYGQPVLSQEPEGTIKMAIYNTATSTQDNVLYTDASYVGLTSDAEVNDTYVIDTDKERLKVLYVQPKGTWKQVFMARM